MKITLILDDKTDNPPVEKTQLFLWYVLCFCGGCVLYLTLSFEPNFSVIGVFCLLSAIVWCLFYRSKRMLLWSGCFFFFIFGCFWSQVRTKWVEAPVLTKTMSSAVVQGTVENSISSFERQKIILKEIRIDGLSPEKTPQRIQLTASFKTPQFQKGDQITVHAFLFPPSMPVMIGGYQTARMAFFEQKGAYGVIRKVMSYTPSVSDRGFWHFIDRWRQAILEKTTAALPPNEAGVAVSLIIGDQNLVLPSVYRLYQIAGITHVLSVSGFHMSLIALLIFFVIRGGLAFFPTLVELWNTKKIAAIITLIVSFLYLVLSDFQTPAVRSFLMIALVLIAVAFDRRVFSLRTVALAAFIILLIQPELILSISFQLSFMAVVALVRFYAPMMRFLSQKLPPKGFISFIMKASLGVIVVSALATFVTFPFVIYYFNQVSLYGILGNLLTGFLFSFVIMPILVLAVLLMPFGLESVFLKGAGFFLSQIETVCSALAELPGAYGMLPSFDGFGLFLFSMGFLVISVCRSRWLWKTGWALICLSALSIITVSTPVFMVSGNGRAFALKDPEKGLLLNESYRQRWTTDQWLKRLGIVPENYVLEKRFNPDFVMIKGYKIALTRSACSDADLTFLIKTPQKRKGQAEEYLPCRGVVYTKEDLEQGQTHEVFISSTGISVKSVCDTLPDRPWWQGYCRSRKRD